MSQLLKSAVEMDDSWLKATHPQKYCFKTICKIMYYLGMGDCWYEKISASHGIQKKLYKIWQIAANVFIFGILFNEVFANFRSDLDEKARNDLIQFSIAHPLVSTKILSLYWRRDRIVVLTKRLLEGTRSIFHSIELERASLNLAIKYFVTLIGTVYMALISALFDAIRNHIKNGVPITTEVVFYPRPSNSGAFVNILRFVMEFHWYYLMAMMLSVDCLVISSLLATKCKFQVVQLYFHNMRLKVLENPEKKLLRELQNDFKKDFVTGLKMHEDALWCARNVQDSMGPIYSIQVFESVGLLVMCLIKMVAAELNLVYLLANLMYITCLLVVTGLYMMASGDITHEASLVTSSIFYSGWELIRARADIRVLAVVALLRSQVPVLMTAFGIITLSYTNFISVIRHSYSFFAVMI